MQFLVVLILAFALILAAFAAIDIKRLVRGKGEFKRHCSSVDPYTGERSGCICGKSIRDNCNESPQYHPLEINQNLLEECGNLPPDEKKSCRNPKK